MTPDCPTTRAEEVGVTALALGSLSLLLCWWYPFGVVLGVCGAALGAAALAAGATTRAPLGLVLSLAGTAASLWLTWGSWARLTGW